MQTLWLPTPAAWHAPEAATTPAALWLAAVMVVVVVVVGVRIR
jgi:hypothetical protein